MKLFAVALAAALPILAAGPPPVEKGKAVGNPAAPVKIEIFSDFQCPACAAFHLETLPQLVKDFAVPGKAYVISREFPLNIPDHKYSRQAAAYAVAAAKVGKHQQVAEALFRNQQSWGASGNLWGTISKVLAPDQQVKVQALMKDPSVMKQVQDEALYAAALGLNSTPTLIVTRGSERFPLSSYALRYNLLKSMLNDLTKK